MSVTGEGDECMVKRRAALRTAILLSVALLLAAFLCACGAVDEEAGEYRCVDMTEGGVPLDVLDCRLLLDPRGTGLLNLSGMEGTILWSREGESLRVDFNGAVLTGSISGGVIRLSDGEGMELSFAKEELADALRAEILQRREEETLRASIWLGDWYGWWRIEGSVGKLENTWYDLCARVQPQADGRLYLTLWDEDQSLTEPMGELMLRVDEGETAQAVDGYFWLAGPEEMAFTLTDGQLCAAGHCEGGGESFDYTLCLRRWGERWNEDTERPYYYDDWYRPLIQAGREMPDAMDIRKQTNH